MEWIKTLLRKLTALSNKSDISTIDVDLMTDYVKVIYADLLEWREKLHFTKEPATPASPQKETASSVAEFIKDEPSLEEMTQALEEQFTEDGDPDLSPTPLPDKVIDELSQRDEEKESFSQTDIFHTDSNQHAPERLSSIDTHPIPFPQKKEDVRKFIGINEKFVFINELFRGNRDAYEQVLTELIEFYSTEDAIDWLNQTVARPYDWKEDDFNVQDFYRVLESYYKRRKN